MTRFIGTPSRLRRFLIHAMVMAAASGCSTSAQQPKQMSPDEVVATIGSTPVTLGEVDAKALQESASSFGSAKLVQALYLARRSAVDEIIATRLIELEAKGRGVSADDLARKEIDDKMKAPTDGDVEFWYQTNPQAVQGRTLVQLREAIRSLLTEQRMADAHDRFVETLKAKTKVTVSLEPPRQTVATAGHPSKGPANAPIQMVEFSDFQCPFCQRANPTVTQVLQTYGDKIRFTYRHYPLPNHPNARPAAEAAACAGAQGQFWQYHDQLFIAPDKLSDTDLKAHAASIGLDTAIFNTCVDRHQTKTEVDRDISDANAIGVNATPSFFINGRALDGAQPFEEFKRLIDDELAAKR